MAQARIRRAETADVASMVALYQRDGGVVDDVPAAEARWRHYLSQAPSAVCDDDGVLLGFALGERMSKDLLEISNVLVAAEHRARGLGTALLTRMFDEGADCGYAAVLLANSALYRRPGKRSPESLYRRLGFEVLLSTGSTTLYGRALVSGPTESPAR